MRARIEKVDVLGWNKWTEAALEEEAEGNMSNPEGRNGGNDDRREEGGKGAGADKVRGGGGFGTGGIPGLSPREVGDLSGSGINPERGR